MTYTVDDTMKKLLGAPEAVAVLERFFPKILKNPALQMTAAMTLHKRLLHTPAPHRTALPPGIPLRARSKPVTQKVKKQ